MKIGFIGLGIMGGPMAKNLIDAGYEVVGYNHSVAPVEKHIANGGIGASSIAEVAQSCEVIITMLPNSPDVKDVVLLNKGIANNAKKGTLYIDMSSISPDVTKEIGQVLSSKGIAMLDAPVSGGEAGAINGELAFMVGGETADFERAKPIFDVLGISAILVGPLGSGQTTKLVNQIIVAGNMAALSEGLSFAIKSGTDPIMVLNAITSGLAGSAVMNSKAGKMITDNTEPGFKIDLHIKDLRNVIETAANINAKLPLTEMVLDMFQKLSEEGEGKKDHSALFHYYK